MWAGSRIQKPMCSCSSFFFFFKLKKKVGVCCLLCVVYCLLSFHGIVKYIVFWTKRRHRIIKTDKPNQLNLKGQTTPKRSTTDSKHAPTWSAFSHFPIKKCSLVAGWLGLLSWNTSFFFFFFLKKNPISSYCSSSLLGCVWITTNQHHRISSYLFDQVKQYDYNGIGQYAYGSAKNSCKQQQKSCII